MAKDYFQDIVPPEGGEQPYKAGVPLPHPPQAHEEHVPEASAPDRSIRNINIAPRPRSPMADLRMVSPGAGPMGARSRTGKGGRSWLWILAGVSVLALAILALLFVFRKTTVTVLPQSQPVVFNQSTEFTAYPAQSLASNTLSYSVQSNDFEDSEVVPSGGIQHSETKAQGSITVVNNYSSASVKLIKNTRFASGSGLIFKAPAAIVIPGKGSSPGKITVIVVADKAGAEYNIGPTARFTLPGLQSNAAMFTNVYAYSSASTTGGFSGDKPGVAQRDLAAAITKVRARLQDKAQAFASAQDSNTNTNTTLTFYIAYTDMPSTPEAGNTVRIHESAHVNVVSIPSDTFASAVAQTVAANVQTGSVKLVPAAGFAINLKDASSTFGTEPITFNLSGRAQIVWIVDTQALAQALAGRGSAAFTTIVSNFPGVQSAHARIEPFWQNTFPTNPADIHITIEAPKIIQ